MIEKREKRKKIFYVPGMISLVLIPLFCLYHFYKVDAFKTYGVLHFGLPNKEDFEKHKVGHLRKYRIFNFNNQKSKEEQKLKELRFFIRDLVKNYDTINGTKIQFGIKTDYNTFVDVMSIMSEEKMSVWSLFGNTMYAFAHPKPKVKKDNRFFCGTPKYAEENSMRMEEENRKKELQIFQIQFLKQQWLILLGYLGLVLLNIFTVVKFNKTQKYNQK